MKRKSSFNVLGPVNKEAEKKKHPSSGRSNIKKNSSSYKVLQLKNDEKSISINRLIKNSSGTNSSGANNSIRNLDKIR